MESRLDSTNSQIVSVVNQFFQFGFYTGEWSAETKKPHGQGRWFKVDVLRYEGGWNQGDWDGLGTVYDEDGVRVCTGRYKKGQLHGFATLFGEDGVTVEEESYHVFGVERPDIETEEEFLEAAQKVEEERKKAAAARAAKPPTSTPSSVISFSYTLTSESPVMSAPIVGLFPRYASVPVKMLEGAGFPDLDDDEIPTPTNLEEGKTRQDWLKWVREFYPRRNNDA